MCCSLLNVEFIILQLLCHMFSRQAFMKFIYTGGSGMTKKKLTDAFDTDECSVSAKAY